MSRSKSQIHLISLWFLSLNYDVQDGKTALRCAAEGGHSKIVELLLEKGAADDVSQWLLYEICYNHESDT